MQTKIIIALFFLLLTSPAFAIIGKRPAAPYDQLVPFKNSFQCYGKWVSVKRQRIDHEGRSVPHVGYRCVDDKKIRRKMVNEK